MSAVARVALETGATSYEVAAAALLASSGCTVRNYRKHNTGRAWTDDADWGIEVPHPRGPMSFGVFAHEVGHQLLHRPDCGAKSLPRWAEEVDAETFALACFDSFGLVGRERYEQSVAKHLFWSFWKALRAGASAEVMRDAAPLWWARASDWGREEGKGALVVPSAGAFR